MQPVIHASVWIYRQLLLVYPRELRAHFSNDMAETFEDLLHDAASQRGAFGILSLWRCAFLELATVAIPARLQSNQMIAAALSLLASSLITWVFLRAVG
jgi:hypothetical protein